MTNHASQPRNIPLGDISRPGALRIPLTPRIRPFLIPRRDRLHDSLREISWRLETRDYVLAELLHEHRTLTTSQITAILFTSQRTCRNRLGVLRKLDFVDWFIPVRHGLRLPAHWVPGLLSARLIALRNGEKAPTAKALREIQDQTVATSHLGHIDGTNQFFVDLIAHARHHSDTRLARWWSSAHTAAALGRRVHPDGHGVWRDGGREVGFFLEFDTGGESLAVVAAKLAPYRRLRIDGGPAWPVLFWLPTAAREANLHKRLAGMAPLGVTVATASREHAAQTASAGPTGPAGPAWKIAGNGRRRLHLAELPSHPGQPGPYHPGPPSPDQDPLHLLCDDSD
jgi:hypothetical protein